MMKAGRPNRNERKTIKINEDHDEYKRIQFSLKMSLRLVNARFKGFIATQYNQPGIIFDKDNDKTSVECWRLIDKDSHRDQIDKHAGIQFYNRPELFVVGSIVSRIEDIVTEIP